MRAQITRLSDESERCRVERDHQREVLARIRPSPPSEGAGARSTRFGGPPPCLLRRARLYSRPDTR
jgi:hypothetical protein